MAQSGSWSDKPPGQYNKAPVPCYNCGSPDHLFIACPESTRAKPFGIEAANAKAAAMKSSQGNGYAGQSHTGYGTNHGFKNQKYQGAVVTKFSLPQAPVITRFAPPPTYQQPQNTYAPPNPQPYHQPPPPPPQSYGQYGQNYGHPGSQPPPPPPSGYDQYNQQYGPPAVQAPPQPSYDQYGQQEYPPSQPYYGQQAPQHYSQYPPQYATAPTYQNGQQEYSGPQGPYQTTAAYNGYQQVDYTGFQSDAQYNNQIQGPSAYQPAQWGQPPVESYDQQQNGQQYGASTQPYYAQPQPQYSHDGGYGSTPGSGTQAVSQMAPPVQQPQQYVGAQYEPPNQQYPSEQPYHGNHQYLVPGSQSMQHSYPAVPAYAPHSHEPNLTRESRSASIVSQGQEVYPPPDLPEVSDEEEIEWMLERHLNRRMAKSGKPKDISELTTDEFYSLLCEETTGSYDPIGRPLPDKFSEDLILPPKYNAKGIISKFVTSENVDEFTKSIRDQSPLNSFGRDPAFLDVDIETWCSEFSRWVDDRYRIALGPPPESRSRKRTSSSWEVEAGSVGDDQCSWGQPHHNKRTRIDTSDHKHGFPVPMPASDVELKREVALRAGRDTTPSFDIGEVGRPGENDPWAIEPGEGSSHVENKENHNNSMTKGWNNTHGSQKQTYNKGSRKPSNGSGDHAQAPRKQDSGYASARTWHANGNGHNASYAGAPHASQNGHHSHQNNSGQGPRHQSYSQGKMKYPSPMSSDSDPLHQRSEDSPLTPTSTDLVGQNLLPLDHAKGTHRHGSEVKIKRPQPEVESAYSRRW